MLSSWLVDNIVLAYTESNARYEEQLGNEYPDSNIAVVFLQ